MGHAAREIALFVAVTEGHLDDKYLTDLSNALVSHLLPEQPGFRWKILQLTSDPRVSMYQTHAGATKGLNQEKFVQTDYVVVKAQGHEVIVGSIATYGGEQEAEFLFDLERREYYFEGWQALFQLIPSITGETYEGNHGISPQK